MVRPTMLAPPPMGAAEQVLWEDRPDYWAFVLRIKWSLPVSWIMSVAFAYAAWELWLTRPIRGVEGNILPPWIIILPILASWAFAYHGFLRPYIAHLDWQNTRYFLTNKAVYISFGAFKPRWRAWPLASLKRSRAASLKKRQGEKIGCIVFDRGSLWFTNFSAYAAATIYYEGRIFPRVLLYVRDPHRVMELIAKVQMAGGHGGQGM